MNTPAEAPNEYLNLVKDIAQMYEIPFRSLLRRRFRQKNRGISNGFHPIELKVDNINEFLLNMDILPSRGDGDSVYIRKNDLIATTDGRRNYKRIEEFTHALTALPLLCRKRHVQQDAPRTALEDKEYLDRLLLLDYTHRSGKYPALRGYLLLDAQVRSTCISCTDERQRAWSKKLVDLEDMPDERSFVVTHYLQDIAAATRDGTFDLSLYSFEDRVNNY